MKTTSLVLRARAANGPRFLFILVWVASLLGASLVWAQAPAAAANWTGSIRCEINVTAQGYSHQETQTWTLTGAAPTQQGAMMIYPATWSVTGQGWHDRTHDGSRLVSKWTANVPGPNAPIRAPVAFTQNANGQMFLLLWHAQLSSGGGYTGTDQYTRDGVTQPERRLVQTVYEYQFQKLEALPTDTQMVGTDMREVKMGVGPWHPGDAQVMVTLTWALGRGSAPALPARSLPPPPPLAASAGSAPAGGSAPSGSTPAASGTPPSSGPTTPTSTTPPSQSTPPGNSTTPSSSTTTPPPSGGTPTTPTTPVVVSVSPNAIRQSYSGGDTFLLKGRDTHWTRGVTTVDFGPGVTFVAPLSVVDAQTATCFPKIAPDAAPGPRTITVTTGTEVAQLVNGFTITVFPTLTRAAPNQASQGATRVAVTLTGQSTHFTQGTSSASFGPGISVTAFTVNSPTDATATLSVDSSAVAGARTVTITTGTEAASLPNGFTVTAAPVADVAPVRPPERQGVPDPTTKKYRYRVTATHALVAHAMPYDGQFVYNAPPFHGRDNEIFVTSEARVFDRRTQAQIGSRSFLRSPIHGDTNNSDPVKGIRVQAGSFASTGGIQSGDDIALKMTNGPGYGPFVIWEGELNDGIEYVVLRPAVWAVLGDVYVFWTPYTDRLAREQAADLVNRSAVSTALSAPGISVDPVPELVTTGQYQLKQDKPFGLLKDAGDPNARATWTDQVVVLTREKIETALSAQSGATEVSLSFVEGLRNYPNVATARCTLYLRIERLP